MAFSKTDQKRITILALMERAIEVGAETLQEAYDQAADFIQVLEDDGLFDAGNSASRSSGRSGRSGGRGSGSRSGNRGKGKGGNRNAWRSDPATEAQIEKAIEVGALEEGYTEEELENMTKGDISDLIDSLA